MDAQMRILVLAGDAETAAATVEALAGSAGTVEHSADAATGIADFERVRPDLVVFAHRDAAASRDAYAALMRESLFVQTHPHRALVLCADEEVPAMAAACLEGDFHDYVPVWPQAHDPHRLAMAVHGAAMALRDSATGRRQTVLVVDDDAFVAKLIGKALAGALPVEMEFVTDATAGLAFLRRMKPAVILMDVDMPGMDGVSMTECLKSTPALAGIPVVMLTGDARRETIERSRIAGASDFLVKPFTRDGLIAKLAKHVS